MGHVVYGSGRHSGALGMAAALNTFLAKDSGLDAAAASRFKGDSAAPAPPLLMANRVNDPMIKLDWGKATRARLDACGVPGPEFKQWPCDFHGICPESVEELTRF